MKSFEVDFAEKIKEGDIIVGGSNFGFGHPHPQSMRTMRQLGIAGVIAESYAPAFFRSEMTTGLPLITCPGIVGFASRWDEVTVDLETFVITNATKGLSIQAQKLPPMVQEIISSGSLLNYLKKELPSTSITK